MRGTLNGYQTHQPRRRFIPAHAGNTRWMQRLLTWSTVYPRSRGEHLNRGARPMGDAGLSPLARGTLIMIFRANHFPRFIPARAGNTAVGGAPPSRKTVYPRSRGEHQRRRSHSRSVYGLSPLARGTRLFAQKSPYNSRFIPARAGNTIRATRRTS